MGAFGTFLGHFPGMGHHHEPNNSFPSGGSPGGGHATRPDVDGKRWKEGAAKWVKEMENSNLTIKGSDGILRIK